MGVAIKILVVESSGSKKEGIAASLAAAAKKTARFYEIRYASSGIQAIATNKFWAADIVLISSALMDLAPTQLAVCLHARDALQILAFMTEAGASPVKNQKGIRSIEWQDHQKFCESLEQLACQVTPFMEFS